MSSGYFPGRLVGPVRALAQAFTLPTTSVPHRARSGAISKAIRARSTPRTCRPSANREATKAGNPPTCLALVGAVINEDASCPLGLSRPEIAFPSAHPDEAQTVEIDVAVMALPDVPEQHRLAEAVVRGLGEGAWARNSAAAIVEPVAHNVPVGSFGHKVLRSRLTPLAAFGLRIGPDETIDVFSAFPSRADISLHRTR
jgi:hypothetical protein